MPEIVVYCAICGKEHKGEYGTKVVCDCGNKIRIRTLPWYVTRGGY